MVMLKSLLKCKHMIMSKDFMTCSREEWPKQQTLPFLAHTVSRDFSFHHIAYYIFISRILDPKEQSSHE